jgi:hypothetical protein
LPGDEDETTRHSLTLNRRHQTSVFVDHPDISYYEHRPP